CSKEAHWALAALVGEDALPRYKLTRGYARLTRDRIGESERTACLGEIVSACTDLGSGAYVLYDSWLGPANIGKILAVGVTYIERARYPNQDSSIYTTVPWKGRAMKALESENAVTVALMILETVLELMEGE
ncbi:hypothetical protein Pmar_PMAR021956, partial [Perkinsus marinus ATCC 50983]